MLIFKNDLLITLKKELYKSMQTFWKGKLWPVLKEEKRKIAVFPLRKERRYLKYFAVDTNWISTDYY